MSDVWLLSNRSRLVERCLEMVAERGLSDTITDAMIQGWANRLELPRMNRADMNLLIDRLVVKYIEDDSRDVTEIDAHYEMFLIGYEGNCSIPFSTKCVCVCVLSLIHI